MHQVEDEEQAIGFHRGEVLTITYHHFRDANLARSRQRLVEECIGFFASFLRLEKIGLVEKLRVDLGQVDEISDVDGVSRFDSHLRKIFFFQNDVAAAFVFKPLYDLVSRHFLLVHISDFFVTDGAEVSRPELAEAEFFLPGRRVDGYGNVDKAEADTALPDRAHSGRRLFTTPG